MKKLALATMALCLSSGLYAAEYGVGVTVSGDDEGYTIYAPINISKELRVEPFINYESEEWEEDNTTWGGEDEEIEIGVGAYKIISTSEKTNLIIGGRISYFDGGTDYDNGDEYNQHGYTLAPVLGFEFFPIPNLSIGADIALEYYDEKSTSNTNNTYTYSGMETQTQVNVKFYFN